MGNKLVNLLQQGYQNETQVILVLNALIVIHLCFKNKQRNLRFSYKGSILYTSLKVNPKHAIHAYII